MWFRIDCTRGIGAKVCWFLVHALCVGLLLVVDEGFRQHIIAHTWYAGLYLLLLIATVAQYYWTAGSSPGYVMDLEGDADFEAGVKAAANSAVRFSSFDPSSGRCPYCRVWQPLRTKHCHDCDKCVLRFDHHCVWLGTCIGQFNHRKFWWYVFLETLLCIWTTAIYFVAFSRKGSSSSWLRSLFLLAVCIGLLCCSIFLATLLIFHSYLVATNQTTYEKTRRKRIPYLRSIPADAHPFSSGFRMNVHEFCCGSINRVYNLPSLEEMGGRSDGAKYCGSKCCC